MKDLECFAIVNNVLNQFFKTNMFCEETSNIYKCILNNKYIFEYTVEGETYYAEFDRRLVPPGNSVHITLYTDRKHMNAGDGLNEKLIENFDPIYTRANRWSTEECGMIYLGVYPDLYIRVVEMVKTPPVTYDISYTDVPESKLEPQRRSISFDSMVAGDVLCYDNITHT